MLSKEQIIENMARAMLEARGIKLRALEELDTLWLAYPKKQGLQEAQAALNALIDSLPEAGMHLVNIAQWDDEEPEMITELNYAAAYGYYRQLLNMKG